MSVKGISCLNKRGLFAAFLMLAGNAGIPVLQGAQSGEDSDTDSLLQLFDGSQLHGRLLSVETDRGIEWEHPAARQSIAFRPTNIAWIRFENRRSKPLDREAPCQFQFVNGDEIFGRLTGLDSEHVSLETWFGSGLQAERSAVRGITFLAQDYSVIYEGPSGMEGWSVGGNANAWQYRDGAFVTENVGMLGRDIGINESARIQFDLAWNGQFSLMVPLYTEAFDRMNYSSSTYLLFLRPGSMSLRRVQPQGGAVNLGQAEVPSMLEKERSRIEIRINTQEATVSVLADGELLQRWKDGAEFQPQGTGIAFYSQRNGPLLQIRNLKITTWDARMEVGEGAPEETDEDWVFLANRDEVSGIIKAVDDGKLKFALPQTTLDIPLDRVTRLVLAGPAEPKAVVEPGESAGPWQVRSYFHGGGRLAFELDQWNETVVSGRSPYFGKVSFPPQSIRRVRFNLERPAESIHEWELIGGIDWDFNESN